jgi:hypothetical protein
MLYRDEAFDEIAGKLNQLGLSSCTVCGSETGLHGDKRPVVLPIGQLPKPDGSVEREPSGNVLFMVRIECHVCGHTMLFNSERFFTGDEPILEHG